MCGPTTFLNAYEAFPPEESALQEIFNKYRNWRGRYVKTRMFLLVGYSPLDNSVYGIRVFRYTFEVAPDRAHRVKANFRFPNDTHFSKVCVPNNERKYFLKTMQSMTREFGSRNEGFDATLAFSSPLNSAS